MFVGIAIIELHIEYAQSLKEKRMVMKSLRERLRNTFHCSAAEVGLNDLHQRGRLGLAVVTTDRASAEEMLEQIGTYIEEHADATLTGWTTEMVGLDASANLGIPGIAWDDGQELTDEEDT